MKSKAEAIDDHGVIDAEMLGLRNVIEIEFILLSQLYRELFSTRNPREWINSHGTKPD